MSDGPALQIGGGAMEDKSTSFNILLVEDNSADVTLVRLALKKHQVKCVLHVIQDGERAIQWIADLDTDPKASPLDLLLMDMHLPKHDGEDILQRLRSTERYANTPVVMMTSLDPSIPGEKASSCGGIVHFTKPLSLDEFMRLGSIVKSLLADQDSGHLETALDEENVGGVA